MMFVNQGLRSLRNWKKHETQETRSMVLFSGGYSDKQIARIRKAVEGLGGKLVLVNSAKEMTNYVNSGETTSSETGSMRLADKVTNIDIYAHGVVGSIEFGYLTPNSGTYRFDATNVGNLNKSAFSNQALIASYACRTALGNPNIDQIRYPWEPLKTSESLAAKIAQSSGVTVFAFLSRTEYSNTLGNRWDRYVTTSNLPQTEDADGAILAPNGANRGVEVASTPYNVGMIPWQFFKPE